MGLSIITQVDDVKSDVALTYTNSTQIQLFLINNQGDLIIIMVIIINEVNDLKAISIVYMSYNNNKKVMTKKLHTSETELYSASIISIYYTYTYNEVVVYSSSN